MGVQRRDPGRERSPELCSRKGDIMCAEEFVIQCVGALLASKREQGREGGLY